MNKVIRIGTRESQLAVWQATQVQQLLHQFNIPSQLVHIKSEGDIDLQTPLYEMGVQGIFTKSLDMALLHNKIDIAVHSMKDVPTKLATGIVQAAVLQRANYRDILVYKTARVDEAPLSKKDIEALQMGAPLSSPHNVACTIATSSTRRKAQWLHQYPHHHIENLRGNVNTRLKKVEESNWNGAIFAAAGLERINLRPANAIDLNWMLPAPAQGAIMVVCREADEYVFNSCNNFNDSNTALCTKIERDFLRVLMGGCTTPISALASIQNGELVFKGNVLSLAGTEKVEVAERVAVADSDDVGERAGKKALENGAKKIVEAIHAAK